MLRVLIVDDEPYVRSGLKTIIDWGKCGFEVCGEGVDGNDGLKQILERKPDLAMVDIKMPGLHGIQLIEQAKQQGYKGQFIILTGYSDFKNAQNAIRLGVHSFLLKPIDETELIEELEKLRNALEKESDVNQYFNQNKNMMKEKILTDIFTSKGDYSENDKSIRFCDLNLNFNIFQVMIVKNVAHEEQSLAEIRSFFAKERDADPVIIDGNMAILLKGNCITRLKSMLKSLQKTILSKSDLSIFIGVGRSVKTVDEISASFQDARKIINHRFIYQEDRYYLFWEDVKENFQDNGEKKSIDLFTYFDHIYTYIEIGDTEALNTILSSLEQACRKIDIQPERALAIFSNLYLKLKTSLITSYPNIKDSLPEDNDIINCIYSKLTFHEIIDYLKAEFVNISNQISNGFSKNVVRRMITYIGKNYSKDLKLEKLAELFGYNSAYLGKIFKYSAGDSFNTYLDKVRIENAKSLLIDKKLKVYEISTQIGYKNIDYFHRKFKTYVGMSPKEYAKSHGASSEEIQRLGY